LLLFRGIARDNIEPRLFTSSGHRHRRQFTWGRCLPSESSVETDETGSQQSHQEPGSVSQFPDSQPCRPESGYRRPIQYSTHLGVQGSYPVSWPSRGFDRAAAAFAWRAQNPADADHSRSRPEDSCLSNRRPGEEFASGSLPRLQTDWSLRFCIRGHQNRPSTCLSTSASLTGSTMSPDRFASCNIHSRAISESPLSHWRFRMKAGRRRH